MPYNRVVTSDGRVLIDLRDTTLTPDLVPKGKYFYTREGIRTEGTMELLDTVYPVGSIYMSVSSTNPGTVIGGTWERITGKFLLSATDGGSSGASQAPGNTGGEATHTLTSQEMPSHRHEFGSRGAYGTGNAYAALGYGTSQATGTYYTSYTGSGNAHNNMPPYLAVYVWKRTA